MSCIDQKDLEELTRQGYKCLIKERIEGLLQEKTKVLYEYGIWPWNKKANQRHKVINQQLEILGVYQGKLSFSDNDLWTDEENTDP
ncbi:MAG: hypothetical protein RIC35_00725 [Marinoscillum sp.]